MYIHHVVRTQLYLEERIHARLCQLARQQGRTVSDLVREALLGAYGVAGPEHRLLTLQGVQGLWQDREDLPSTREYVRRLRTDTPRTRNDTR